jgi:coenzyme PQQ precursor peptide PqqA
MANKRERDWRSGPGVPTCQLEIGAKAPFHEMEDIMKIWNTPQVREQAVGLEVTSYLPAEIDII